MPLGERAARKALEEIFSKEAMRPLVEALDHWANTPGFEEAFRRAWDEFLREERAKSYT